MIRGGDDADYDDCDARYFLSAGSGLLIGVDFVAAYFQVLIGSLPHSAVAASICREGVHLR